MLSPPSLPCWCTQDDFEWGEGYNSKFGILHVNPVTLDRYVKQSGKFMSAYFSLENMVVPVQGTVKRTAEAVSSVFG